MSTFRELFDEWERGQILLAVEARISHYKGVIKRSHNTETSAGLATIDRCEDMVQRLEAMVRTLVEESN